MVDVAVKTRKSKALPEPLPDLMGEALKVAEEQLADDREVALQVLRELGENITEKKMSATSECIAKLLWLEHRITQAETMATPLWCQPCSLEGNAPAGFPGARWMVFECLRHAADMNARTARSWERSLFGGLR